VPHDRSINFVLSSLLFNIVPTALEMGLVTAILASQCGWKHAGYACGLSSCVVVCRTF
jgi:ABC-type transport system involved in Fe-S cluster assembly fused permease/ATPase subunit